MKFSDMQIFILGELVRGDQANFEQIRELFNPQKQILLLIDSQGGSCSTGFTLAEIVLGHENVTALVLGLCDSMAIPVLQACSRRIATPRASFLFHSLKTQGNIRNLDLEDDDWVEDQRNELLREQERYYQFVLRQAGDNLSKETVYKWCKQETRILAPEALTYGLIDRIIDWKIDPQTLDLKAISAG